MNKLLDWFDNENLTLKSPEVFFILLNDYDQIMRRDKTNAFVKLFYKQFFSNFVIQKLIKKFNSKEHQSKKKQKKIMDNFFHIFFVEDFKISYVRFCTALSSTLRFLPESIIQQKLRWPKP
jgi:hypothetical protein